MAVLIEAISVVIRRETIADKYPGGLNQYVEDSPNRSLCMDEELVRVGFMIAGDASDFIASLEREGFNCVVDDKYDEIAVVDQFAGIYLPCDWLEFLTVVIFKGDLMVKACNISGNPIDYLAFPAGWDYEHSLSKRPMVTTEADFALRTTFLRHENGIDIFWDKLTGKEVCRERAMKRNANA